MEYQEVQVSDAKERIEGGIRMRMACIMSFPNKTVSPSEKKQ